MSTAITQARIAVVRRPMRLPPGLCLTDIWDRLTPRRKLEWIVLVEDEVAGRTPAPPVKVEGASLTDWPRDRKGHPIFTVEQQREGTRWYRRWTEAGRPGEWPPLLREAYLEHARSRHQRRREHLAATRTVPLVRPL